MPATPPARTHPTAMPGCWPPARRAARDIWRATVIAAPGAHAASRGTGFGTWARHLDVRVARIHAGRRRAHLLHPPGAPAPTGQDRPGSQRTATGPVRRLPASISSSRSTVRPTIRSRPRRSAGRSRPSRTGARPFTTSATGRLPAGAIHWTFSALAPAPTRTSSVWRSCSTTRHAGPGGRRRVRHPRLRDGCRRPRGGSVRVDASTTAATGTLTLVGATFVATGTSTLADAAPGVEYPILADTTGAGRPYTVSGTGHLQPHRGGGCRRLATGAVRTPPAPPVRSASMSLGSDAAPRVPLFSPTISTQVRRPT